MLTLGFNRAGQMLLHFGTSKDDYRCSHSIAVNADQWPDDLRLSGIEDRFTCTMCGKRGADVRPDFNWLSLMMSWSRVLTTVDTMVAAGGG